MIDTLIIGVGNPERGDDGAGIAVARVLKERVGPGVRVVELGLEAFGLIDLLRSARSIIVIDAAQSGAAPGTIHRFDARSAPLPAGVFRCASTHDLGITNAIELGRALSLLPEEIVVFGIEGEHFTRRASLSPAVEAAVSQAAERVAGEAAAVR